MLSIPLVASFLLAPIPSGDPEVALDLVVHEWGTFTSVQSSLGVTLEGVHHEEEALPEFVHQMDSAGDMPLEFARVKGIARQVVGVTVKMETPVTYFYAPRGLAVRARVTLEHGLLSQWYPWAHSSEEFAGGAKGARDLNETLDFRTLQRGWLEWELELLAPKLGLEAVPAVEEKAPWLAARIPASNCVRARAPARFVQPERDETEQFLFYRGLARFDLPIRATVRDGAQLAIENTSRAGDTLTQLFVLHVADGRADFQHVAQLAPGAKVELAQPLTESSPKLDDTIARLTPAMERALVASGLYEPEARAMVATWSDSYFRTEGLRVLYVLPQRFTDTVLPLEIDPRPRECVRVLVGRLECLTPEVEREVADTVRDFERGDDAIREAAWQQLARHERFLEPLLRRADEMIASASARACIANLLRNLGT